MPDIDFVQYQDQIQRAVNERLRQMNITDAQGFTIVKDFVANNLQSTVGNNVTIGGPVLPVVAVVANSTGQVHYFTLKSLLPELEIR